MIVYNITMHLEIDRYCLFYEDPHGNRWSCATFLSQRKSTVIAVLCDSILRSNGELCLVVTNGGLFQFVVTLCHSV